MATDAPEESGIEELLRLSREIISKGNDLLKEKLARAKKKQFLQSLINDIKYSMVMDKLEPVAAPEIIKEVSSFTDSPSTAELRRLILDLISKLEEAIDGRANLNLDTDSIRQITKTLAILVESLFDLEKQ